MLKDVKWSEDGSYTPQGAHTPVEFFNNALKNSILFDIQLGYFNSAAINVLSHSFATFIKNGGSMRMAINQIVSKKDKKAISEGAMGGIEAPFDLTDWESIHNSLDEYGEHFFKCLSYLIQEKRIEIQIIKPRETSGIAHTKRGQFVDNEGMVVGFSGSANFTLGGLFNNLENLDIFLSTSPDKSILKKLENNKVLFTNIMSQNEPEIEYLSADDLEEAIKTTYGPSDIDELLDVEKKLAKVKITDASVGPLLANYNKPKFPFSSGPREYQKKAFQNWKKTQSGLFNMATGTGKTLTALNCLLQIYNQFGYYKALILVPTITLVEQWEKECEKFNFRNVIKVCSKNSDWKSDVDRIIMKESYNPTNSPINYIIISTYCSFARDNVFNDLTSLSKKVLLIADEAHNMGSKRILDRLEGVEKRFKRRIGLSATPERQFDERGNMILRRFFNSIDEYTFVYTMEEAINNKFLCQYYYYPHVVRLCNDEMYEYMQISEKLGKIFRYNNGNLNLDDEIVRALLLKRRRIIHKARNKKDTFKEIIKKRYKEKGNLKYTLVYVPEGIKPEATADVYDTIDIVSDDDEANRLINEYTQIVMDISSNTTVRKFVAGQKDREEILNAFANGDLEVLTSMKCLDEGVDVPRSELAIFCASTGNPRQFIQRRGRILRNHKDKKYAYIHDLVVVPDIGADCQDYDMERKLILSELRRVRDFASLSKNLDYSYKELEQVLDFYKIPLLD